MRKYYILVGRYGSRTAPFEMIFGDYDKAVVTDEKDDTSEEYKSLRVITLDQDNQAAIDAKMHELNNNVQGQ